MSTSQPARRPDDDIATRVAKYGFAMQLIGYGYCSVPGCCAPLSKHPWTYTVGLVEHDLPELVLMGLHINHAAHAVNWTGREMIRSGALPVDVPFDLDGVKAKLVRVPPQWLMRDPSRMAAWLRHYGTERDSAPDVQQLLWPDQNGRFPDDPLFDRELRRQQPLLSADPYRYPKPYVPRSQGRHRKRRR